MTGHAGTCLSALSVVGAFLAWHRAAFCKVRLPDLPLRHAVAKCSLATAYKTHFKSEHSQALQLGRHTSQYILIAKICNLIAWNYRTSCLTTR